MQSEGRSTPFIRLRLVYSDSSHITLLFVNSVLLSCSFYYKLFLQPIVRVQRLLSASKQFFFPAESPDHLLLVKGASAPLKTKTKVNCATVVEFEATILSCTQCPHNHRNGERKVSQSQQQIIF